MSEVEQDEAPESLSSRAWLAAFLVAAAVSEAVLDDGGFRAGPRWLFAGLALAALAAASACDRTRAAQAARQPVVVVLWLLGLLGIVSAAWTVAGSGSAIRWGLVTLGYGALVVCGSLVAVRRAGIVAIAVLVALLGLISAIIGLAGATAFSGPYADLTTGFWRPGGTLEYSAALALLEVSALPVLLRGMASRRRLLAAGSGFAAALAATDLALSHSRLECAFAALVCLVAWRWPRQTVRSDRSTVVQQLVLLAAVALSAYLIAGGKVSPAAAPHQGARLGALAALCAAAAAAWSLRPAAANRVSIRWLPAAAAVAGGVALTLALAGHAGSGRPAPVRPGVPIPDVATLTPGVGGGLLHGRLTLWKAAIETAVHGTVLGHGADSFLTASLPYQHDSAIRFAHDLPLELAVELGVLGLVLSLLLYWSGLWVAWRARTGHDAWLLMPAAVAFLLANLVDWEWHLAGSGAVWAIALGGLIPYAGAQRQIAAAKLVSASGTSSR